MFLMFRKTACSGCFRFIVFSVALAFPFFAHAEPKGAKRAEAHAFSTARFTLYIGSREDSSLNHSVQAQDVAEQAITILDSTIDEINRIFAIQPTQRVVLRFLSPEEFRNETGSPEWTSAMYYGGEITVPITPGKSVNLTELRRALRHEYVHAIVAQISAQHCPAWLDEGLAQIIEGPANPILGPSLREWVADNDILPLAWLQDGFMTLDEKVVPVAYAQSLYATRSLVNSFGFGAIREYLLLLGDGSDNDAAFRAVYDKTLNQFENQMARQIALWAESSIEDP